MQTTELELDEWRCAAEPFYEVYPRRPYASAGVTVGLRVSGQFMLSKLSAPEQMLVHDPSERKGVCHDYLLFERFFDGGGLGEIDGISFEAHPLRMHLIDMSRRYVSSKKASRSQGVLIPHHLIAYDPSVDPAFVAIDFASARGRLLATAQMLLFAETEPDETEDLCSVFMSLIERFMLRRENTDAVRERAAQALPFELRSYIDANLGNAGLNPSSICSAFGISRSVLYRNFEDNGGVARYLRNKRLDRCYLELAGAPPSWGQVSAVAKRWGFRDANTFLRQFKERFGIPPSSCLASDTRAQSDAHAQVNRLATMWLKELESR